MAASLRHHVFLIFLSVSISISRGLHLTGEWNSANFYMFLTKFGFQKTVMDEKVQTRGYIYGNISVTESLATKNVSPVTLVLVDSEYFLELYGNSSYQPRDAACERMFKKLHLLAWHGRCNPLGTMDLLRAVPCPNKQLCVEEDTPSSVQGHSQLTFAVQDTKQPRYWYLSLVACQLNATCHWVPTHRSPDRLRLSYDLWLVNGQPTLGHINKLEHQFSFEEHDIIEVYLAFFAGFLFLLIASHWKVVNKEETLSVLFVGCVWMQLLGAAFTLLHLCKFANDGQGLIASSVIGQLLKRWADVCFIVLLIFTARGGIQGRPSYGYLILILLTCITVSSGFFGWALSDVSPVEDVGIWDTVPACLLLALRFPMIFWFIAELRNEDSSSKEFGAIDLVQFAAGFLLWMLSMPLLILIAEIHISSLWREKCILSVSYSADLLSMAVYCYILYSSQNHTTSTAGYDYLLLEELSSSQSKQQVNAVPSNSPSDRDSASSSNEASPSRPRLRAISLKGLFKERTN